MYYVLDRAYAHRIIGEYRNGLAVKGGPRGAAADAQTRAEVRAAELNAWNDEVDSAA